MAGKDKDKDKDKGKKGKKGKDGGQDGTIEVVPLEVAAAGAQLGVSLLLGLALSAEALMAAFEGDAPFTDAALRFLLCFVIARVGAAIVWSVYRSYREANDRAKREREEQEQERMQDRSPFGSRSGDLLGENR
jgi:hypothetical protein